MAVVTSSIKPETEPILPVKPTLSRRATAFSIDAIMASECRKSKHVTDTISGSDAAVGSSPWSAVTSPSARKSTVSGQLSVYHYCVYILSVVASVVNKMLSYRRETALQGAL